MNACNYLDICQPLCDIYYLHIYAFFFHENQYVAIYLPTNQINKSINPSILCLSQSKQKLKSTQKNKYIYIYKIVIKTKQKWQKTDTNKNIYIKKKRNKNKGKLNYKKQQQ